LINQFNGSENLDLQTILDLTKPRYPDLRKPNGKPYTAASQRRSIKIALSANGLFKETEEGLYVLNREQANKWVKEEV